MNKCITFLHLNNQVHIFIDSRFLHWFIYQIISDAKVNIGIFTLGNSKIDKQELVL